MRVVPALFIAISFSLCANAWATTIDLDDTRLGQLSRLEQQYFKHSFDNDSDETRIGRLEKLVFGQSVRGEPNERVKNLLSAAASASAASEDREEATPQSATPTAVPPAASPRRAITAPGTTVPPVAAPDRQPQHLANPDFSMKVTTIDSATQQNQTKYPRITTLESDILGQTYEADSLSARLSRMETKAFGRPSNQDLSDRTDALEAYASKKLHKKTLEQQEKSENTASNPAQQSGGLGQKLFNMVEKSLLGGGSSGAGPGGAMAMGSGPGMGIGMGPGMGMGMGMGRMGHRGMRQQQQQQAAPAPAPKPEDPALHAPDPPPASARMSTQVGWCEVQVFGKTFPEKHLPDRLGQLNRELQYKIGKSDIELMDDMSGLIKAVQMRSNRTIGASSTAGIR